MHRMIAGIVAVIMAVSLASCASTTDDSVAISPLPRMTVARQANPVLDEELRELIIEHCARWLASDPVEEYAKKWRPSASYPRDINQAATVLGTSRPLSRDLVPCWNYAAG